MMGNFSFIFLRHNDDSVEQLPTYPGTGFSHDYRFLEIIGTNIKGHD